MGEVIEEFSREEFGRDFYEFIHKYGEGMIQLDNIEINGKYTSNKFSVIGIYNMLLDKYYSGFIMLTYKKGHEDRCMPRNYLKTICSYLSININNWKRCKDIC